jgi:hypothetical protein
MRPWRAATHPSGKRFFASEQCAQCKKGSPAVLAGEPISFYACRQSSASDPFDDLNSLSLFEMNFKADHISRTLERPGHVPTPERGNDPPRPAINPEKTHSRRSQHRPGAEKSLAPAPAGSFHF